MINKNLLACLLVCVTLLFSCKEVEAQEQVKVISPQEMRVFTESGKIQLIDVRTPNEFIGGHLNHAINMDFLSPNFSKEISTLDKEKPVFIYCHSGGRSGKSVKDFLNAGFTKIYDLKGGIMGWKSEDLPVVID